ncbi:MAG TPA: hypothetical protein ENG45_00665 [Candidatus Aenigmarchaeota archaeon]|nr:hypothetical protein [Candidatus Aenigmarchaeota archaeon]
MKGISGKIIATVITLILAMFSFFILWRIFKVSVFGTFIDLIERAVEGFVDAIIKRIPILGWFH